MKSVSILKWINNIIGKNRIWIIMLSLAQVCQGVSSILFALEMRDVIDNAVNKNWNGFKANLIVLCIIMGIMLLMQTLSKHFDEKSRANLEISFRKSSFSTILHRSYAEINEVHSGEWMNRLTSDVNVVISAAIHIVPVLCGTVIRLVGALTLLFVLIPKLVIIVLPAAIAIAILSLAFRNRLKSYHRNMQETDGKVRSFMQERINSLIVVKSFTQEEQTEKQADKLLDDFRKIRMRRIYFVNACTTAMNIALRGAYLLGFGLCSYSIFLGGMTYGTMMAIMQLINQVESPFTQVSGILPQYYSMLASAERLIEIEKLAVDTDEEMLSMEEIESYYENEFSSVGLNKAYFSYKDVGDGKTHVLDKKSIEIKKGEYVAFVGESGCGKSTAMKLMMCLYQLDSGERYIKTNKGTEEILTPKWRRLFAYVPQGNCLVSGTIREVISFSNPELMKAEKDIEEALKIACADTFVKELPRGIDTELGELGAGLSEGQIQRLAIARAIMSKRPILLLDEATSALDGTTEEMVLQNLRTMTDRTVVLITHRPAALTICDRKIEF